MYHTHHNHYSRGSKHIHKNVCLYTLLAPGQSPVPSQLREGPRMLACFPFPPPAAAGRASAADAAPAPAPAAAPPAGSANACSSARAPAWPVSLSCVGPCACCHGFNAGASTARADGTYFFQ